MNAGSTSITWKTNSLFITPTTTIFWSTCHTAIISTTLTSSTCCSSPTISTQTLIWSYTLSSSTTVWDISTVIKRTVVPFPAVITSTFSTRADTVVKTRVGTLVYSQCLTNVGAQGVTIRGNHVSRDRDKCCTLLNIIPFTCGCLRRKACNICETN